MNLVLGPLQAIIWVLRLALLFAVPIFLYSLLFGNRRHLSSVESLSIGYQVSTTLIDCLVLAAFLTIVTVVRVIVGKRSDKR